MSLGKPRLSLSKTEVAKLTQCLAMLPFPPLPVRIAQVHNPFDVDTDKDDYNAFEMATAQLRQDARTGDGILNSHSAVGAAICSNAGASSPSRCAPQKPLRASTLKRSKWSCG